MDEDSPPARLVRNASAQACSGQPRQESGTTARPCAFKFFRERAPPPDLLPLKLMLSGPIVIAWSKLSALSCA